jgi:hypothetical protein
MLERELHPLFECHEGKTMSLIRDILPFRVIRDKDLEFFLYLLART